MKRNILFIAVTCVACFLAYTLYDQATRPRFVGGPVAIYRGVGPTHGYLGINFAPETDDLAVTEVYPGSPGLDAGFHPGDYILFVDEEKVFSRKGFYARMRKTKPMQTIKIGVSRNDERITLVARLCSFAEISSARDPPLVVPID